MSCAEKNKSGAVERRDDPRREGAAPREAAPRREGVHQRRAQHRAPCGEPEPTRRVGPDDPIHPREDPHEPRRLPVEPGPRRPAGGEARRVEVKGPAVDHRAAHRRVAPQREELRDLHERREGRDPQGVEARGGRGGVAHGGASATQVTVSLNTGAA
jgi:hypothetical protein